MPSSIEAISERVVPEDEVNWNVVRLIVEGYTARHGEEVRGCALHVQRLREEARTAYGEWGTESRARHVYELPTALEMGISIKYPKALKGENLRTFLGMFPEFQVAEKL